jgi:hypothetical protein
MIKLLLGRLLPAGAAAGMFMGALSPLSPALDAFGVAANALAGDTHAGGAAVGEGVELPSSGGIFSSLFAPAQRKDHARRQIEGLVESLKEKQAKSTLRPAPVAAPEKKKKRRKAVTSE